ncbi:hypothetical protein SJAV_26230 [Sulfurisphaera javensis]|uniref:CRISPR type III-B/RAMP module-associated protein Cmr5 n=1 Tax=Sulfurisphaera javensis TaxID=2049879 RepID=A0AAT9GV58_9CREN
MALDPNMLAIEYVEIVNECIKDNDVKERFRSRARNLLEEIFSSGFLTVFLYIISKSDFSYDEENEIFSNTLDFRDILSEINSKVNSNSIGKEKASYMIYLLGIIYFLVKNNLVDEKSVLLFFRPHPANGCRNMQLLDIIAQNEEKIFFMMKKYLLSIKMLASGLFGGD